MTVLGVITPAEAMTNIRQEAICGSFWAAAQIHDGNIGSSRFLKFSFCLKTTPAGSPPPPRLALVIPVLVGTVPQNEAVAAIESVTLYLAELAQPECWPTLVMSPAQSLFDPLHGTHARFHTRRRTRGPAVDSCGL